MWLFDHIDDDEILTIGLRPTTIRSSIHSSGAVRSLFSIISKFLVESS
jgi:hypothetical protein